MERIIWRMIDKYIFIPLILAFAIVNPIARIFQKKPNVIKKILIIKLAAVGDTILLLPTLKALKGKFPCAKIYVLATNINADVFKMCSDVDKIIVMDLNSYLKRPFRLIKFLLGLRSEKFDVAIDFEQRIRFSAVLAYLTGAGQRFGFMTNGYFRHYLFTTKIPHNGNVHDIECFKELVSPLVGNIINITSVKLEIPPAYKEWARCFLESKNISKNSFIIMHPGCGTRYSLGARAKEWPVNRFTELANILAEKYGLKIGISAGAEELWLAKYIASHMKMEPLILNGFDLGQLAALLENAKVLIVGDTGIMHLAAALDISIVALFGPSDPIKYRPLTKRSIVLRKDLLCSPCLGDLGMDNPKCREFNCMKEISVEEVLNSVKQFIKEGDIS